MAHRDLDIAQHRLRITENLINAIKDAAAEERRITHDKHISEYYQQALDRLEVKLVGDRASVSRLLKGF
jgi:CRP-like cAMP-binding protein